MPHSQKGKRETSAPLSSRDGAPKVVLWASFDP